MYIHIRSRSALLLMLYLENTQQSEVMVPNDIKHKGGTPVSMTKSPPTKWNVNYVTGQVYMYICSYVHTKSMDYTALYAGVYSSDIPNSVTGKSQWSHHFPNI